MLIYHLDVLDYIISLSLAHGKMASMRARRINSASLIRRFKKRRVRDAGRRRQRAAIFTSDCRTCCCSPRRHRPRPLPVASRSMRYYHRSPRHAARPTARVRRHAAKRHAIAGRRARLRRQRGTPEDKTIYISPCLLSHAPADFDFLMTRLDFAARRSAEQIDAATQRVSAFGASADTA